MRDAYDNLFRKYGKEAFFTDSIDSIIFIADEKSARQWARQKELLLNNGELYIRGYGRDALKTDWFFELYKNLFENNKIKKDSTNNARPTKMLSELTPFCKNTDEGKNDGKERIQNYQVSHLFGRAKNPLLFTAAWNIAYIPKYLDPFTGHESQGEHSADFKSAFNPLLKKRFSGYIKDYNNFINQHVNDSLEEALNTTRRNLRITIHDFARFRKDAKDELSEL